MKLFANTLYFGLSLQLAAYLLWAFQVFGPAINYPIQVNISTLFSVNGFFDLSAFNAIIGIGGASAIMLAGILTRTGTYAIYAVLLWGIGVFINFVKTFFLAIPNTIAALLPAESNPFAYINGVYDPALASTPNPIFIVISVIFAFGAFMYIFGLVFQREML